jgi:transglutaminase-like putative cysteine protease
MATRARVVAPFALAALSIAAALSLSRVLDSGRFVLPVIGAALLPHAIGALARRLRWSTLIWLGLMVVALDAYVVWILVPSTTWLGIPTSDTLDTIGQLLRDGWNLLRSAPAPAPVTDGTILLAVLATWTVAAVADWLAFRRNATLAACAPALVLFVWSSTLGTSDHQTLTIAGFAVAAGVFLVVQNIAVLDRRRSWLVSPQVSRGRWLLPAVFLGLVALTVGLVLAPALPGAESDPILDFANPGPHHNGGRSYRTRVPPLVDVRDKLKALDNVEVFTVRAAQRDYWRIAALDDFASNGQSAQWTLSAEGSDQVSTDLPQHGPTGSLHQEFDIETLGERWLPAAYRPVATNTPALVVTSSGTLVSDEDSVEGLRYTVDSTLAPQAPVSAQQQAQTARPVPHELQKYTALPGNLPTPIRDLARQVVTEANATTPYAQAAALRDFFWANFTYDIGVDLGDDTNAISTFLQVRRGFCVQFASTYAVMARSLGIPARVAVGFTPGRSAGDVFHVQSHDAHAWPEFRLAGLGWTLLFDPTPPANATTPGGSSLTAQAGTTSPPPPQSTVTTLGPSATTSPPNGGSTPETPAPTTLAPVPSRVSTAAPDHGSNPWFVVIALLAAIVAAIVLYVVVVITAKSRRRARRREAAEPAAAVQGAWEEALDSLHVARVPRDPALTPLEFARSAPRHGVTAATRPLRSLASTYTISRYGTTPPSTNDVDRAWASVEELDRALDTGVTRWQRLRRRLDPSPLRTRSGRRV